MTIPGGMSMPPDFRYRETFLRGKPKHARYDEFRVRYPGMSASRRAKLFAPFDALKGFGEAVASVYRYDGEADEAALPPEDVRLREVVFP